MNNYKVFSKSFLDKLKTMPNSKSVFLGFIGVGASYSEALTETAKCYNLKPEYEIIYDNDTPKDKEIT